MNLSPFIGLLLGLLPTNLIMLATGAKPAFIKGFNLGVTVAVVLILIGQLVNFYGLA